ncbi:uncharacterized protein LOC126899837 [Daktulosphaira vitifoliae]|uniref:uncharacterized protein LOC126899837 n=1 Tax=Daktulosphaira vitifoliae TaxID=58002 RepID=UPI0021AAF689|nr:uncharacterized protein LOC126899837 [Daktulosphaira vitifoliae]
MNENGRSTRSLFVKQSIDNIHEHKLPNLTLNYMGERLNIDPAIVNKGFRLIAIKATTESNNSRLLQSRNSFYNMKEPDVAKLLKKKLKPLLEEEKELNTVINQQICKKKTHLNIKQVIDGNKIN